MATRICFSVIVRKKNSKLEFYNCGKYFTSILYHQVEHDGCCAFFVFVSLSFSFAMDGRTRPIKLFRSLHRFYQRLDIHHRVQNYSINLKILCISISIIIHFATSVAFFSYKAKTLREHGDSLYVILSESLCMAYSTTLISKKRDIFKLIKIYEKFIEKSTPKRRREKNATEYYI